MSETKARRSAAGRANARKRWGADRRLTLAMELMSRPSTVRELTERLGWKRRAVHATIERLRKVGVRVVRDPHRREARYWLELSKTEAAMLKRAIEDQNAEVSHAAERRCDH